jgi:hypothetical protein
VRISGVWYRAAISAEQRTSGYVMAVRDQFAEAITAAGDPEGACLFTTNEEDAVYFSPASVSAVPHLIALLDAQPSPAPERESASLLAGTQKDWDLLPRTIH